MISNEETMLRSVITMYSTGKASYQGMHVDFFNECVGNPSSISLQIGSRIVLL